MNRFDALASLILLTIVTLLFGPLYNHLVRGTATSTPYTDHPAHNVFAAQIRQEHRVIMPHPLYHFTVIGIQTILDSFREPTPEPDAKTAIRLAGKQMQGPALAAINHRYASASITTLLLGQIFLGLVLWRNLRIASGVTTMGGLFFAIAIVMGLMLVGPVAILHPIDDKYYFGYIAVNVWHSPTVIVAKPFALLTFTGVLAIFSPIFFPSQKISLRAALSAASDVHRSPVTTPNQLAWIGLLVVVILGALAKPSFLLCLVPAVLLMGFMRPGGVRVHWNILIAYVVLPAALVLAWQMHVYAVLTTGSHAKFAPFETMSSLSGFLGIKLLLSVLFPVICYAVVPGAYWDFRLNLAWLVFIFGLGLTYLIAESHRTAHGNFLWSAQLALFVLFVESARVAVQNIRIEWEVDGMRRRTISFAWICGIAFLVHVGAGVFYFVHLIRAPMTEILVYR